MSQCSETQPVIEVRLDARETECIACGEFLIDPPRGVPLYEGEVVPVDSDGEWAGFDACRSCWELYDDGHYEALQRRLDHKGETNESRRPWTR